MKSLLEFANQPSIVRALATIATSSCITSAGKTWFAIEGATPFMITMFAPLFYLIGQTTKKHRV
jgi:hypothetical protein